MWYYKGEPVTELPESVTGFVYLITEIDTGRMYVGKKLAWKSVTRKVKGKKKKISIPSDWVDYYGSSASLKANIEVKGKKNYRREILHLCRTRGEMSYLEMREQFERRVLFSDEYFNEFMGCRINSSAVKHLKEIEKIRDRILAEVEK